ncbi:MAG: hypothetical protein Q4E91_04780 [Lachnospiraceae bacterium]|nr:hypothetical protein [Lachnospiraceae bacterium]
MSRAENQMRQQNEGRGRYPVSTYVDGNTIRKLQTEPRQQKRQNSRTSSATRKNRERALQMNFSYVLFLTVAAVVTVMVCINYLKLQSESTALQKEVTSLSTQLSELKLENDSKYNRIISSVDLEEVKDVAMNELGMVYASESQIKTYDSAESDYVKQYREIPAE